MISELTTPTMIGIMIEEKTYWASNHCLDSTSAAPFPVRVRMQLSGIGRPPKMGLSIPETIAIQLLDSMSLITTGISERFLKCFLRFANDTALLE